MAIKEGNVFQILLDLEESGVGLDAQDSHTLMIIAVEILERVETASNREFQESLENLPFHAAHSLRNARRVERSIDRALYKTDRWMITRVADQHNPS